MNVLVFSMEIKEEARPTYNALLQAFLDTPGVQLYYHSVQEMDLSSSFPDIAHLASRIQLKEEKIDIIISAGGDGTMLKAVSFAGDAGIPFLGFNLGRLGFLAVIEKEEINNMVEALVNGNYILESRSTLKMNASPEVFDADAFALNDFTILKRDNSSMIRIHSTINGEYLNTYWADGLILATPTGSTGYSLSCGGPIIFPQSGNFVLTPIAPHNLNVRPIVFSDDSVLEFKVEGRTENFLCTLDSRYGLVTSDHKLTLQKNNFNVNLVKLEGYTFLKTLRDKLMWGLDQRN
ncbi:MAG: NAD kinase [Saprospiraceae bacterium]|nr:NAD kinase [Saprospiraceae bacterium]MBK8281750.1 NAD kinase [Saprospiraceae bacterium]MBK9680691.1 NAD kinase [Saprospiraceae bacterium]